MDIPDGSMEHGQQSADGMGRRGQILWVRGLTRLQQQVSESCLSLCVLHMITVASPLLTH